MEGIWGKSFNYKPYSDKALNLFTELITESRREFRKEYSRVLEDYHHYSLYDGQRYSDNEQVLWVLQSQVTEAEFTQLPKHYIFRVLLGACSADYYYRFEKEW
jgi:hypothetical protein